MADSDPDNKLPANAGPGAIANHIMSRVVYFALLSYFTVLAARNYKANRHLGVTNRHKSLALATFGTFVSAAEDPDTRKQVLLETTRAIFDAGSTGYGDEPAGPADRIGDIINNVIEKK
jgi:hypothetical protein